MTKMDSQKPEFFKEGVPDPMAAATGGQAARAASQEGTAPPKRKAGFYLSQSLLDRFNTKFYELKLAGVAIENKSALLELALAYALDDLDQAGHSALMERIQR